MSAAPADSSAAYPGYGWMLRRSLWILLPVLSLGLLTGPVLLLLGWRARASNFLWPGAVYAGASVISFLMNEDAGPILRTLIWILGTIHCLIITPAWLRVRWRDAPAGPPRKPRAAAAGVPAEEPGPAPASTVTAAVTVTAWSPADRLLSDPLAQAAEYYADTSGGAIPSGGANPSGGASGSRVAGGQTAGAQTAGAPLPGAAVGALLLNVNAASERDLRQLPGIGQQRAAQTVRLRREEGLFSSLEDYGRRLSLGPQGTERLRGRVSFGNGPPSRSTGNGFGRKVDY
ncbi:helix-hairpin-helix domain-containing protein [Arthrobacter sp. Helios]|uniref:ComEA family DNA-binding protein n=1 Tax=Arthrobacter sp. Helios TaxID=2828862 RepID=UPI00204F00EB|nr:helix-hairpin-helix domain-containing protein [Arthrobacter sp. Helios]UPO77498.1 helix-hairpin-helix domain-containing protein [Arthrobacter sp. Helios]